jgi:3-methyladenine DNA glycosylase AlkD
MDAGPAQLTDADERAEALAHADGLVTAFAAAADPERAAAMARYMKDRFEFFGLPAPARRRLHREVLGRWQPDEAELVAFVDALWTRPERELQYAACDVLERGAGRCSPALLAHVEDLITTRSWWDSVDSLAHAVGNLIRVHPQLAAVMDEWIEADDFWLARVALIYQLSYKDATDADRLFRYCARRADDTEFFVRKAIGWALREYSKTDPEAVVAFVTAHETELSPLSRREALRRILSA